MCLQHLYGGRPTWLKLNSFPHMGSRKFCPNLWWNLRFCSRLWSTVILLLQIRISGDSIKILWWFWASLLLRLWVSGVGTSGCLLFELALGGGVVMVWAVNVCIDIKHKCQSTHSDSRPGLDSTVIWDFEDFYCSTSFKLCLSTRYEGGGAYEPNSWIHSVQIYRVINQSVNFLS